MSTLAAASVRHLLRHPAQLALTLIALALGVGTIVAVDIATASARRAFELSLAAINGPATHQIEGGPVGIDEQVYARLQVAGLPGAGSVRATPVVAGYVTVGERVLQLIGVDPLSVEEPGGGPGRGAAAAALADRSLARQWFTTPGSVVMSAGLARSLAIPADGRFTLAVGGVRHAAQVIVRLRAADPGYDGLILTDIAQAQEWLRSGPRLSRIDLQVPAGATGSALLARLRAQLPAGFTITGTRAAARETFAMTDAFTTNLRAMSLLALLVGTLLVYGAVSFAVLERRPVIAVLRALGATRREILVLVLCEAAVLGLTGAALGALLGVVIGHALLGLVSQTINDLYFVVSVRAVSVPPRVLAEALAAGVATALLAALLPALELAGSRPQLTLARSAVESRVRRLAGALALAGAGLALAAGLTVALSGRSLLAGFVALFLLLVSVAATTPAALRALSLGGARLAASRSPVTRLALADVGNSLSRTGVAIAALGMALAAMIGVAIMVESFRESLREWLDQTMRADVYVSAPGVMASLERRLQPAVIEALLAVPGVRAHTEGRRVEVGSPAGPVDLTAVALLPESHAAYRLTQADAPAAWRAFTTGAVLVSEPLAWRLSLHSGSVLRLETAAGLREFPVAGVYREYGNERGEVLMDLGLYRRYWQDPSIAALGLYLTAGSDAAMIVPALRQAVHGRQALLIRSNADIRRLSMQIFERTFVITRVLYWLAAGVAALGLLSALLAWQLTRARELALLRTLGLTPAAGAVLGLAQTLFMGIAAFLAALPAGVLTALVLTDVINRRAFGWQIDLHLRAAQFSNALWLALAAALAAGLYPAWRSVRAPLSAQLREE
jgi:putative ABC transport system permease protein